MESFVFGTKDYEAEMQEMRPSALPPVMVPAMAYVPLQFFETAFDSEEGFRCGTVFPELAKPFTGCDQK